ncbi:hypothetical protein ACZ91_14340 [Streptomyces regensis]|nr:hypothetical protein ACZ91_14340 [Streptomyces regensis]
MSTSEQSTSIWSAIESVVFGLALIFTTGCTGLPITLPCPVGNRFTTPRPAAMSVTHSAAADEVSMKCRPGRVGASAGASAPTIGTVPVLTMLPIAFSSMVESPPAMLPCVGWDPRRFAPVFSIMST